MGDKSIIAFLCGVVSCYILTNSNKLNKLEDEIYMLADPNTKIGRPRQVYTGYTERDYTPSVRR